MDEARLLWLRDLYQALANVNRLKILLFCSGQGVTVTQLAEELGISYNLTSAYVNVLARRGLVSRTPSKDNTVTVRARVVIAENGEVTRQ
jgi:predicted transcriptional regulator